MLENVNFYHHRSASWVSWINSYIKQNIKDECFIILEKVYDFISSVIFLLYRSIFLKKVMIYFLPSKWYI